MNSLQACSFSNQFYFQSCVSTKDVTRSVPYEVDVSMKMIRILKILFFVIYIETPTVKEAIFNNEESVEIVVCDTAMLCLLLHHMTLLDIGKNIFMSSMKLSHHVTYRIKDVLKKDQIYEKYILFVHAFCRCDTKLV